MAQRDLRTPVLRIPRRSVLKAVLAADRFDQLGKERGQGARLLPQALDPDLGDQGNAQLEGAEREDGRSPDLKLRRAGGRPVVGVESERRVVPHPALQGRAQPVV